jgi:hypothetical protein
MISFARRAAGALPRSLRWRGGCWTEAPGVCAQWFVSVRRRASFVRRNRHPDESLDIANERQLFSVA